jgi:acyl-CoA thioesterase FadM
VFRFERDRLKRSPAGAFKLEFPVRFQDVDAAGIIFYPCAIELSHDTYVRCREHAGSAREVRLLASGVELFRRGG